MSNHKSGIFTREEIDSQSKAWAEIIPLVTNKANDIRNLFIGIEEVVFAGCGSSFNVALWGAPIFQIQTGIPTHAFPAAEIYVFSKSVLTSNRKTLAVLFSRSGKTTEVIYALDYLRKQGIRIIGITCAENSQLAIKSDIALVLTPILERSIVTTRSFTGMLLTTQLLAAIVEDNKVFFNELCRLPELCKLKMEEYHKLGKMIGRQTRLRKYTFVGNGPFFGLARESQLKIKEMTLLPADSYPMFDFRHGPQSNVNENMLVVAFISDSAQKGEFKFLQEMKNFGGVTWALCDQVSDKLRNHINYVLELKSELSELARGPLYMPAIQLMAYHRSLTLELNPDKPYNVPYWVDTSE